MKNTQGFIALSSVLIMSAILLSISISIASRAIDGTNTSLAFSLMDTARYAAEACAEHALMELVRTHDYTGSQTLAVGEGACDILTIEGEGITDRTIRVQSSAGEYSYKIEISLAAISPEIVVTSFLRVEDFSL